MSEEKPEGKKKKKRGRIVALVLLLLVVIGVAAISAWSVIGPELVEEYEEYEAAYVPTDEEISEYSTLDPDGSAAVDAAQEPYGEDDTWAIYVYMVGSDLESGGVSELSATTKYLVDDAKTEQENLAVVTLKDHLSRFVSELDEQDMDLPDYLYLVSSPTVSGEAEADDSKEASEIEGYASADLDEMTANELPENISLVLQTGGAAAWDCGEINPNRSQRFLYDSEGFRRVEDNHIADMGDSETLTEFLRFCSENYPADHVMLLFWDHGAGTFGFGADEIYGNDGLALSEMKDALSAVYEADPENPPIDLIGFDACLMGSAEVAESLYGYAGYLAASEEVEPGQGWEHDQWIADLIENPQMTAAQLGRSITDSYINSCVKEIALDEDDILDYSVCFSTIDLNAAHEVYQAYADLCAVILQDMVSDPSVLGTFSRAANQSTKFGGAEYMIFNTVDLGLMMENLQEDYPEEAGRVLQALDEAVLYHRATKFFDDTSGLSIYFPGYINDPNGIHYYLKYVYDACENEDIQALYYYKLAGCLNDELQDYTGEQGYGALPNLDTASLRLLQNREITMGDGPVFSFAFEEEEMALVQNLTLGLLKDEDGKTINLGEDVRLTADDNLVVTSEFDGTWLSFDGNILEAEVIDRTEDRIRYRTEVLRNGTLAWLLLTEDTASGKFTVSGVYYEALEEAQGAIAERAIDSLEVGDTLRAVYTVVDSDYAISKTAGDRFSVNEDSEIGYSMLEDGDYYMAFNVYDVRGDTYDSPYMQFTVENGKVTSAEPGEVTAVILGD